MLHFLCPGIIFTTGNNVGFKQTPVCLYSFWFLYLPMTFENSTDATSSWERNIWSQDSWYSGLGVVLFNSRTCVWYKNCEISDLTNELNWHLPLDTVLLVMSQASIQLSYNFVIDVFICQSFSFHINSTILYSLKVFSDFICLFCIVWWAFYNVWK